MKPLRISLGAASVALALAACAGPTAQPPVQSPTKNRVGVVAPQPAAQPKLKKPVNTAQRGDVSSISLADFFALQQSGKALIYDARPAFFYHLGHVPGALNLPKNNCDEVIAAHEAAIKAALAEGKSIVVYCSSFACADARTVATHLSAFGYPTKIFSGGWDAWKEAGMPAE